MDSQTYQHHAHAHPQHPHQHSHALPSLSPTDIFNGLELATLMTTTTSVQPGPRLYKSRKYRPCDFCRARQVACKINNSPPCQLCSSHGRECTFVERPKKKRRPNAPNGESSGSATTGQAPLQNFDVGAAQLSPGFLTQFNHENSFNALNGENGLEQQSSPTQLQQLQDGPPIYNMDPSLYMMQGGVRVRPLDSQLTRSARFIGETGESNPYLLRHYHYDDNDECTVSKITYRRIKSSSGQNGMQDEKGEPPVVFMLADDSLAQKGEPRVEDETLAKIRTDVTKMFSEQEALRLIGLFNRFVYPYFPIICKSELCPNGVLAPSVLQDLPLSLLSAIYATALPFMLYDDLLATTIVHNPPPAHTLFRIAWISVTQELHTPRLATLQACLLLLQRAPTNRFTTDTPWKTSLVGWTVSLAQTLGLSRECSDWSSLPSWEITLRRRLWFGVFIMDKWASLGAGMPSHIRVDDVDVLPLTDNDLDGPSIDPNQNAIPGFLEPEADTTHFKLLSELTTILSDIMDSYFSLRATQRTSKDFPLSLQLARSLRERLKNWNDSLPPNLAIRQPERSDSLGSARLSGNPSLSLAFIVTQMTLFRALLRPLENLSTEEVSGGGEAVRAVRQGAKQCAKDVVEFVEHLGRGALDAFWHSWSRANFAIASSFLMQLHIVFEHDAEFVEVKDLVARWRWAMRIGSGNTGNGLMSLGLLRLDGMMRAENGSVSGNANGSVNGGPGPGSTCS
ncbi:hypothetical protein HYALB_00010736 [Hymenoscyphus albidus]|uniref:Zn(2)-C6 fungal-type domain-containing protein n=1 Tax=Hymenoscyphus albidus TaxID=595503 RepID=A0A9N9LU74_9HELO|nr:hypothetical protein HYALB_00010736 [Hymenoscyphus albidus]